MLPSQNSPSQHELSRFAWHGWFSCAHAIIPFGLECDVVEVMHIPDKESACMIQLSTPSQHLEELKNEYVSSK